MMNVVAQISPAIKSDAEPSISQAQADTTLEDLGFSFSRDSVTELTPEISFLGVPLEVSKGASTKPAQAEVPAEPIPTENKTEPTKSLAVPEETATNASIIERKVQTEILKREAKELEAAEAEKELKAEEEAKKAEAAREDALKLEAEAEAKKAEAAAEETKRLAAEEEAKKAEAAKEEAKRIEAEEEAKKAEAELLAAAEELKKAEAAEEAKRIEAEEAARKAEDEEQEKMIEAAAEEDKKAEAEEVAKKTEKAEQVKQAHIERTTLENQEAARGQIYAELCYDALAGARQRLERGDMLTIEQADPLIMIRSMMNAYSDLSWAVKSVQSAFSGQEMPSSVVGALTEIKAMRTNLGLQLTTATGINALTPELRQEMKLKEMKNQPGKFTQADGFTGGKSLVTSGAGRRTSFGGQENQANAG